MIASLALRRALVCAAALLGLLAAFAAPAWSRPTAAPTIQSSTAPYLSIDPLEIVNYAITYTTEPNRWANGDNCYFDNNYDCAMITDASQERGPNNSVLTLDATHFIACAIDQGFGDRVRPEGFSEANLCSGRDSSYKKISDLMRVIQPYITILPESQARRGDIIALDGRVDDRNAFDREDVCWWGIVIEDNNPGLRKWAAHSVSDQYDPGAGRCLRDQELYIPEVFILRLNTDPQPPQVDVPAVVQERDYIVGQQAAVVWSATDLDEPDAAPAPRAASGVRRITVLREGAGAPVTLAGDAGSFAFDAGICTSTTLTITAFDGAENSAGQTVTVIVRQYGDLDRSGVVDWADVTALETQLGQTPGAGTAHYDLDGDGALTEDDLLLLERQLGASCTTPEPNPYP